MKCLGPRCCSSWAGGGREIGRRAVPGITEVEQGAVRLELHSGAQLAEGPHHVAGEFVSAAGEAGAPGGEGPAATARVVVSLEEQDPAALRLEAVGCHHAAQAAPDDGVARARVSEVEGVVRDGPIQSRQVASSGEPTEARSLSPQYQAAGATDRRNEDSPMPPGEADARGVISPQERATHHLDVLGAYARIVAVGAVVLGGLCLLSWQQGGGWPLLLQALNMGAIVGGSLLCLALLAWQRTGLAFAVFMLPSIVGCTWGIVHAPGAVVAVYVLGIGLLAFLGVFLYPGRSLWLTVGLWVVVYLVAIGLRLTGVVPVHATAIDQIMLVVAPAMQLVILVLAGRITIGRLDDSQRRLEAINRGLEQTVAERTDALRSALAEAERLLLNVLPRGIAARLRGGEEAIADAHAGVTILFADIVGFTALASRVDPVALVGLLNDVFTEFDHLAERHGLEKIKTIGDAYMVVGGAPQGRSDHAEAVARLALEMHGVLREISDRHDIDLDLRIGMHSGPVVAGVIGRSKFSYDMWGDTVNIASRLESHGEPGRIQLSSATRALLGDGFDAELRGTIVLKGRGPVEAWWLLGARS